MANGTLHRIASALALTLAAWVQGGSAAPATPAPTIYVAVSAQSPVTSVADKDLLALYTGRVRTLPDGTTPVPLDQQRDGAARAEFYQALTGMDIARINSYWARLHFTGQVQPPQIVGDEAAMLKRLRSDPTAIGYLTREPSDASVRVVLRLP